MSLRSLLIFAGLFMLVVSFISRASDTNLFGDVRSPATSEFKVIPMQVVHEVD